MAAAWLSYFRRWSCRSTSVVVATMKTLLPCVNTTYRRKKIHRLYRYSLQPPTTEKSTCETVECTMNIVKMSVAAAPLQILLTLLCGKHASSYSVVGRIRQHPLSLRYHSTHCNRSYFYSKLSEDDNNDQLEDLSSSSSLLTADEILAARQFKIVTCSASSCATKRKKLRLDEYATYTLLYERLYQNQLLDVIPIEETSCLGSCSMAPCVAIEHEEYDGTVALMGMDPSEFQLRAFHQVVDQQDAQRIWDILLQSIKIMAQESHETDFNEDDDDVDDNNPNAV